MKTASYRIGMLVDHPNRPQWGPGKIVHLDASKVHVFFRDDLERKAKPIVFSIVQLSAAASQSDAVLDALPAAAPEGGAWLLPASYGKPAAARPAPKKKASPVPVALPILPLPN